MSWRGRPKRDTGEIAASANCFRDTSLAGQEGATAFAKLLLAATQQEEIPVYVAITMRSDYLGDCANIPGLAEAVNDGDQLIPRLSRTQRRAAIEKPVHVGGGTIDTPLVHRLLNDVGDDADQLPVFQHALMRIWDQWAAGGNTDEPIGLRHYEMAGGLREALSLHADEVFEELPTDRHRVIAQKVFQALTERGTDNRGIRRPTRFGRLCQVVDGDPEEVALVIDAFRRAGRTFLMPPHKIGLEAETVVDISHESLMRIWKRLREWVEVESQSARINLRLAESAMPHAEGKSELQRKQYSSDMLLAQHAYRDGNVSEVLTHLFEHAPGTSDEIVPGIEWYLWWNACHRESSIINRSGWQIYSLAISPDGRLAADSSWSHTIRIREVANPQ